MRAPAGFSVVLRPRQDSNLRSWLRRPLLYPLSYEGGVANVPLFEEASITGRRYGPSISRFKVGWSQRYSRVMFPWQPSRGFNGDL